MVKNKIINYNYTGIEIFLWWDSLLTTDAGVGGLILSQRNVPDLVDIPLVALPFLKSEWGVNWGSG